ncbi:hypothetical protein GCM10023075_72870 [Streptosporangium album]
MKAPDDVSFTVEAGSVTDSDGTCRPGDVPRTSASTTPRTWIRRSTPRLRLTLYSPAPVPIRPISIVT